MEKIITDRVHEAIIFAAAAHSGQKRKATDLPYIIHPMEVLQILCEMDAGEDLKIAGLLHDTLEDTETTPEQIEKQFGKRVLELVQSNSENKELSWQERKQHTIDLLCKIDDIEIKMLILADKLANLKSMLSDYEVMGEELWERFNAPKDKQAWYYKGIIESLESMEDMPNCRYNYQKIKSVYKQIFK